MPAPHHYLRFIRALTVVSSASDVDADANPGVPGVYHSHCIGPLTPPGTVA